MDESSLWMEGRVVQDLALTEGDGVQYAISRGECEIARQARAKGRWGGFESRIALLADGQRVGLLKYEDN